MKALDPIRFLLSNGDVSAAKQVLVVQTGSPELLTRAVDLVRAAVPGAAVTVLLQKDMTDKVPAREGVEYQENVGSKRAIVDRLRARRFDAAFVLYFNHPGFWKLKLLPFMIGAGTVIAVNEHMGWFPVSLRHAGLIRHLSWRIGNGDGSDGGPGFAERAVRAAVKPAAVAWLAAYEGLASLRADTGWKRQNRHR